MKRLKILLAMGHAAVANAVEKVDCKAGYQPHGKPYPGKPRQRQHKPCTETDAQKRNYGNKRAAKTSYHIGMSLPQHDNTAADNAECKQRADIAQFCRRADVKKPGKQRHDCAGQNLCYVGGSKSRMDFGNPGPEQPVTGHGEKNARLAHKHD